MASTSNNNGGGGAGGAVNKIDRAHQMYRDGRYEDALGFYTEALSVAKTNPQKIALHSNRAACYLKLHNFKMAAEECTWVLELDHDHTGALMLRAQTLVTLKEYNSALFDVNRLIELNPSSEVYRNLLARLKTQLMVSFVQGKSLAPIPEDDAELEEDDEDETELQADNVEKEREGVEECEDGGRQVIGAVVAKEQKAEVNGATPRSGVTTHNRSIEGIEECEDGGRQVVDAVVAKEQMAEVNGATPRSGVTTQNRSIGKSSEQESSGWQAIPKPKGHSQLDYSRWDRVEDESSEEDDEDDDDDESQPQYRFRVRTVGVRAVK